MTRADYQDTMEGIQMRMDLMMRSDNSHWSLDTYMILIHTWRAVFIASLA